MNIRIHQLAKQASLIINQDVVAFEKDPNTWVNYFSEKFAELIVKECIKCINKTDSNLVFTAQSAGIVTAAHSRSIKKIKEHFGLSDGN